LAAEYIFDLIFGILALFFLYQIGIFGSYKLEIISLKQLLPQQLFDILAFHDIPKMEFLYFDDSFRGNFMLLDTNI